MTASSSPPSPAPLFRRINLTAGGSLLPIQQHLLCGANPADLDSMARQIQAEHEIADNFVGKDMPSGSVPAWIAISPGQSLPLGTLISWHDDDVSKIDWSKFR